MCLKHVGHLQRTRGMAVACPWVSSEMRRVDITGLPKPTNPRW